MQTPGATRPQRPGPLRGRGLRDRLDRQPLHFGPAAVAGDPRGAGVDDVADARHGQRRLGDVGGQHDAAAGVRLRTPAAARRSAAARRAAAPRCCFRLAQGFCGVADLALAGQEDQDVAGRFGLELVDGVDDRLGLVAHLGADDFVVGVVGVVII